MQKSNKHQKNILFCNEGFIIDGVASYNLYLSAALSQADNHVAIVGRWAGFKGFQKRHRELGVRVIQCPSITVDNGWLVKQAIKFQPDVIITDSRRSFPFAWRIQRETGARVVTVFHDPPQFDRKGKRSIEFIIKESDAWITAETSIYEELLKINTDLPVYRIQRPITGMVHSTALPSKDPFRVLCLGRLSRWKSPGLRTIVERANELKQVIPSIKIDVVGGGRRRINFWLLAMKANLRAGEMFVRITGTQTDPQEWIRRSTVVCAGATAAIEGILSKRPVLAFSGFWLGLVTPQNLSEGISTHFGERKGDFYLRDNTDAVIKGLIDLYQQWEEVQMSAQVEALEAQLRKDFDSDSVAEAFESIIAEH